MYVEFRFESGSFSMDHTGADPLSCEDLLRSANSEQAIPITLYGRNAEFDGVRQEGHARTKASVAFDHRLTAYALVDGGWLPPPFVVPSKFLVDRNIVARLKQIHRQSQRADSQAARFWLTFFEEGNAYLNPFLCAFEGRTRSTPTFSEFIEEYQVALAEIQLALPKAQTPALSQADLDSAYQLVLEAKERAERDIRFLLAVVPMLTNRVATRSLKATEESMHVIRDEFRISTRSFAFLAALACLYEDEQGENLIGRGLIKPRPGYDYGDAYNAVSDMRHLEILVQARSTTLVDKVAVCTCDRGLALFWSALAPTEFTTEGASSVFRVTADPLLFPRMDAEALQRLMDA